MCRRSPSLRPPDPLASTDRLVLRVTSPFLPIADASIPPRLLRARLSLPPLPDKRTPAAARQDKRRGKTKVSSGETGATGRITSGSRLLPVCSFSPPSRSAPGTALAALRIACTHSASSGIFVFLFSACTAVSREPPVQAQSCAESKSRTDPRSCLVVHCIAIC